LSPEKGEIHPGETLAKRLRLLGDEESHRKVREHGRRSRHSKHERRVRDDGPTSRSLWNRQEDTDGSVLKVLLGSLQPAELDAAGNEKDQRPKDERDALNDVRVRHRSQTADRFDDEHDERKDENTTVLTDGAVGERLDDFTHRHELRDLVTKDWQQETAPRQHTKRVRRGLISRIRRAESIVHELTQREIPARFPQRVESRRHDQKAHVHAHTRGNPSRGEPSLQPRLPRDPLDGVSRE